MSECVAGEAVIENRTESTCSVAGSYDTVVYCTVCGGEISRETTELATLAHDYAKEWSVHTEPTVGVNGEDRKVCANDCGAYESRTTYLIDLYFKNRDNWSAVHFWGWNADGNIIAGDWPGNAALTLVEGTTDWYHFSIIIYNIEGFGFLLNNGQSSGTLQTGDLSYDVTKRYISNGQLYASMEDAENDLIVWSNWYFRGDENGWGTGDRLRMDENGDSWIILTVTAGKTFKIATADWQSEKNASHLKDKVNFSGSGTSNITVKVSGTYKFIVTKSGNLVIENQHEHTWVEATCTAAKYCSDCKLTVGTALGHEWDEGTVTPATCIAAGNTHYTCIRECGETKDVTIPALGHVDTEEPFKYCDVCNENLCTEHNWVDATCAAPKTCSVCGSTEGEALPHNYVEEITTPATHVTKGVKTFTCSNDATHTYTEEIPYTFTAYFKNVSKWSNVYMYSFGSDLGEFAGSWAGTKLTLAPGTTDWYVYTKTSDSPFTGAKIIFTNNSGSQTADLTYDSAKIYWIGDSCYESMEAANADFDTLYLRGSMNNWGTTSKLVKNENGNPSIEIKLTAGQTFKIANSSWTNEYSYSALLDNTNFTTSESNIKVSKSGTYVFTVTDAGKIEVHLHSYTGEITTPATCTENGVKTFTCSCGDSYTESVPAAHTEETLPAKDATCTETGLTEGKKCSVCNEVLTAQEVVPATGHATEVEYWTYSNNLYLVPVCGCLTEKVLVDTTEALPVSNEADLVYLLTHGFNVKLAADIDLTATIDIEGAIVTLDLNGKTLKADWESDGLVEVIHVHDASHLTIVGEGNVISGGTYTAETNSVISCRVYSMLTIKGGNYYSASCGDVIFCETSSIVRIEGGHFEAAEDYYGTWYVLDIDETETYNRGQFVVTGGTFVNFDPANHTNDSDYTNKVADGYHSIGNNGVYTVSAHSYDAVVTDPDCVNGGYTTYTCVCGHSYVDTYVDANGHSYNAVVTDPTCTTDGYTTYKCSVCGDTYVDNKVASKGHVKGDAVIEKEVKPTCETKGSYETVVYCTVCDAELDRTTAIVPKLGHTAGEAVVENRVESTCTVKGSYNEVVYCSVCKTHKMSETKVDLPLADHNYEAVVTAPTCTVAGCTTYTCSVCGDNYTDSVVNPLGHTNGAVVVENENAPTCTASGSYDNVVYCTVCSAEVSRETITVNALSHTEVSIPGKEATCTETGLTEGKMCSVCGTVTEEQETISAGHNYENGVCSNCGFRKTTANVSIQNYASANGWANETKHAEVEIDHNVIASLSGTDTYTSSYYTTDYSWRMYQTGTAKLTITASNNATIVSVKITYLIEKTGILTLNGKNITSGTVVEVNDSEIVFGVGNTSTATNGQVRITGIEVVYTGGATPCEHTDVTEIEAKAATCTTDGYKAHYQCNDCEVYYADEDCTKKIANVDVWKINDGKVPMTGHDYVDGECHCGEEDPNYGEELTEISETISFASTAKRTSQTTTVQVWKNGGVTFTNNKGSSTSSVANYSNPVRLYAGSNIVVEATGKITSIVFDCNSSSYATALNTSIGSVSGATVTVSNDKVTVTFSNPVDSFTIAKLSAQVRLDSITVTYLVPDSKGMMNFFTHSSFRSSSAPPIIR